MIQFQWMVAVLEYIQVIGSYRLKYPNYKYLILTTIVT